MTVEDIMNEEIAEAQKRATARVAPLLKAEFNRLAKRYPKLRGVLFGNGTYYIDYEGYSAVNGNLPKAFAKLEAMCSAASGIQPYVTAYEDDLKRSE